MFIVMYVPVHFTNRVPYQLPIAYRRPVPAYIAYNSSMRKKQCRKSNVENGMKKTTRYFEKEERNKRGKNVGESVQNKTERILIMTLLRWYMKEPGEKALS